MLSYRGKGFKARNLNRNKFVNYDALQSEFIINVNKKKKLKLKSKTKILDKL